MKYLYFCLILITVGCISDYTPDYIPDYTPLEGDINEQEEDGLYYTSVPMFIEINNVPPPFDVAGNFPYVLWINGQRVPYAPVKELTAVVDKVGRSEIKEIQYADIHKGWLYPHMSPPPHDEPETQGRTRSVRALHGE